MNNLWTNLFNHQKTYTKPTKPISSPKLVWDETYEAYLTQLIQELENQIVLQQQVKNLLEISHHLAKALATHA